MLIVWSEPEQLHPGADVSGASMRHDVSALRFDPGVRKGEDGRDPRLGTAVRIGYPGMSQNARKLCNERNRAGIV